MYDICSRSLSFRLDDILITFHHDVNGKIARMWANIPSGKKLLCFVDLWHDIALVEIHCCFVYCNGPSHDWIATD